MSLKDCNLAYRSNYPMVRQIDTIRYGHALHHCTVQHGITVEKSRIHECSCGLLWINPMGETLVVSDFDKDPAPVIQPMSVTINAFG